MKKSILIVFALVLIGITSACSKDEGYGGMASIEGKVYGKDYNSSGNLVSEGYLGEVRVYISAHDESASFDDVRTSYDGSYKFDFLQEGTYDIWVFGDCDYCPWSQIYDFKTVSVSSRNAHVKVEDFIITF